MVEAELRNFVLAKLRKRASLVWQYYPDSRKIQGVPGAPDLFVIGPHGCLFRELKGSMTRSTMPQMKWGRVLNEKGLDYRIWTPEDLESGQIDKELDELA